ncbi:CehA/McbA family metallohydrolase [Bacillus sp. RG28]|uniref:CehA/McbA family metallohydrolase n=1 Tax=Gottfriedia endophytica TaxID=2820819 RepID=A0A940NGQ7_9BACI|nr:DUF4350 domain-containing protein [Gottfriedia endophytica]MBP0723672.1 CehA/McbA family metallohydrolase [Gottfriedia endophytica]
MNISIRKYRKWVSLVMLAFMLISLVIPPSVKADSTPVTLAKWDFTNGQVEVPSSGIDENITRTIKSFGTTSPSYSTGPGTPKVPVASNWKYDTNGNSSYWRVSISTKNYSNITVSSKQRSSGTGPKDFKLQYSLDDSNWLDVPNGNVAVGNATWTSGGLLTNIPLPADANDKDNVYVRWIVSTNTSAAGGTLTTGTSNIADIEFKGQSIDSNQTPNEKTALPDVSKISFANYTSVTGDAGAVPSNAKVNVYFANDNTPAVSATANNDGSFNIGGITNPQFKDVIYITAQETGKDPSDKVSKNYSGVIMEKTTKPVDTKIIYDSYSTVTGTAGAVANNATVKAYYDDNSEVGSSTATSDGSFAIAISSPKPKSQIFITAQEDGKIVSDKATVNYTGATQKISPGDVVFSQLYVNGGNSNAFYNTKFFELYNNTDKDIDLSNWSIAYTSAATMNFGAGQPLLSGTIKAHGYFLVAGSSGATGQPLPVKPDATINLNPSGSAGGALVLAKTKTAVSGVDDPNAIDLIAYGNGTATFKNPLYWGNPIIDSTIGSGTLLRKTNIGSDPRTAFGLSNGWFTKDPSQDFVMNKQAGALADTVDEMVVHNSNIMLSPDSSKITFKQSSGTSQISGQSGSVPASATVKAYVENNGSLQSVTQATATANADGSFTMSFSNTDSVVYLTHTDNTQPTPKESIYTRINVEGTNPPITPIGELRKNDANGLALNTGYTTTIEGVASTDNAPTGTNFFIQDATGAINVVNSSSPTEKIQAGQKLKIDGRVVFSAGMTQFVPSAIQTEGNDVAPIPTPVAIGSIGEANEGQLVTFKGTVSNVPTTGPVYDVTFKDDTGKMIIVRVQGTLGNIEKDSNYTITGTVAQFKKDRPYIGGYYVIPRTASDIKGQLLFNHTTITKAYVNTDVSFSATAKNVDSITLYYKGKDDTSYQTVSMSSGDGKSYNGKINKDDVPKGEFYYYMEAVSGSDKLTNGTASNPNKVPVVVDKDGPAYSDPSPMNGESIDTRHPTISVKMEDPNGVDTKSVDITVDGKNYTSKAIISETDIKLSIPATEELAVGEHGITVNANDKLGNSSTYTWKFTVAERFTGGHHYRGTTHNHTNISHDATGSPEDALKAAQKYHYDFFAFSDHSHDIDSSLVNKDTVDRNGMKERTGGADWKLTKELAKQYTTDGQFVVFPGFEMTSTTWGHSNVFGTDNFVDRVVDGGAYQNLQKYYSWALTYDDIVAQFNHPKMSANAFDNFIPYNKNVDKLFTMLEVGNGSGKYSYANAEDKYYSALDLGWHVAPTYGEDNHDATWGQTKKRTIIVAKDLTTNSLMDAMRHMRVYMSEDPNFTLDMSASGFYMGSTTDTNTLDFKISGEDPVLEKATDPEYSYIKTPSNDNIAKVELITIHGKVVDSYVPTSDTTSFNWSPSLTVAGGQQWFVVKVTQKDGDQIYSAPIWSPAKDLAVGVSDISTTDGAIVGDVQSNLTAGISNQGSINVSQLTAKFYYDNIDESHLIGSSVIDSLPANTTGKASVIWTKPVAGNHKIIVTLSAADGNDLGNNKYEQDWTIKAPLNKVIMIDGSHNNENTKQDTGTYKDNFKLFTTLMKQQGYTIAENAAPLTDTILSNVATLVITHPASAYTANEISAINKFVSNGGSLLVTEKSNFGGSNQNINSILSGVNSSILVNNDGVFDETTDGNFWGTPLTSNFSVRLHPTPVSNTLTDFVPTIEYYSGASLAKNDGTGIKVPLTDSDTVTVLVKGNESTFQDTTSIKSDSVSYNVKTSNGKNGPPLLDVKGGSALPMTASEQIGKGRVIVSGMNIFNDKQMDQSFNPKGNDPFAINAVNWLNHLEPKVKSIGDARNLPVGTDTVVEGTVVTTAFFDAVYIQDNTGGIMAFNDVPAGSLQEGDKIRIYGHIKTFENNLELEFGSFANSIVKIGTGPKIVPKFVSTLDSKAKENQGQLIKVKGKVTSIPDETSYIIDDGSGETLVFTDGYIINQSGDIPKLNIGDTLEAVGLTGEYSEGNRIRVRDTRELVKVNGTDTSAPTTTVTLNPSEPDGTNGWYKNDVTVTLTAAVGSANVLKTEYSLDGENWIDYESPFIVSSSTKVYYRSTDIAGNQETEKEYSLKLDKTAPVTTKEVDPSQPEANGSYKTDVNVTLKATDDLSGVQKTEYSLDGENWTKYDSPFKVSSSTKVYYRSTDNAGNQETQNEFYLQIDKGSEGGTENKAPVTILEVDPSQPDGTNGWYKNDVTVTLTAAAGSANVLKTEYSLDGENWIDYESPFIVSSSTKVYYRSTDIAGNQETEKEYSLKLDKTAPVTTKEVDPSQSEANGSYKTDVNVTLKATDDLSGVQKTEYSLDGENWTKYDSPFKVSSSTKVYYRSTDNAGNQETQNEFYLQIDKGSEGGTENKAPVTILEVDPSQPDGTNGWYKNDVTVTLTAAAGSANVLKTEYSLDGENWIDYESPFIVSSSTRVYYRSTDIAGNQETEKEYSLKIDKKAPVTTVEVDPTQPNGANGSYKTDVNVTLRATDDSSGVLKTEYSFDGTTWKTYESLFKVSSSTKVYYRSMDNAGNQETLKEINLQIDKGSGNGSDNGSGNGSGNGTDKTAPVTNVGVDPSQPNGTNGWYKTDVTVTLRATDDSSGVQKTEYSFDGTNWKTYGSPFKVSSSTTVYYRSTDKAGNQEELKEINLKVDKSVPVTTVVTDPSQTNGWNKEDVKVTLKATDDSSGVQKIEYSFDGTNWKTYESPFTVSSGSKMYYRSTDKAGNQEELKEINIKVDKTAPVTTVVVDPSQPNGWYKTDVKVTLKATDDSSGVQKTEYSFDGTNWKPYESPFTVSSSTKVFYRSKDNAGNQEAQKEINLKVDKTAPVTTVVVDPSQSNGWYKSDVKVTLRATDDSSGVQKIEYSFDGTNWKPYSSPFIVSSSTKVYYRSVDNAGNQEAQKDINLKVDKTAPITIVDMSDPTKNGWFNKEVKLSLQATDENSGVDVTQYRINGEKWTNYTKPFTLSNDGKYTIEYRSIDKVGNTEATKSVDVKLDQTAPKTTVGSLTPNKNGWFNKEVKVTLQAKDELSGVDGTQYRINGGEWTKYTTSFTISKDGKYNVEYRSIDKAGNTEAIKSVNVKLDKTAPIVKLLVDHPVLSPNHKMATINVKVQPLNSLSGIDTIKLESIKANEALTSSDIQGANFGREDYTFALLADSKGKARVYTITYVITDKAGNVNRVTTRVTVSKGK